MKIETYLLLLYTRWAGERKSVLSHADETTDFGFYEALRKEVLMDCLSVFEEYGNHQESAKHLGLDTHWDVIREKKREAEPLAASQAATEAHSSSSETYEGCVEVITSPTLSSDEDKLGR